MTWVKMDNPQFDDESATMRSIYLTEESVLVQNPTSFAVLVGLWFPLRSDLSGPL